MTPGGALPRLGSGIPHEIAPQRLNIANARIARFLIHAGLVREADIPAQWRDVLEVCRRALNAWLNRELGDLHCIAPRFVLRPAIAGIADGPASPAACPPEFNQVEIIWFQERERQWAVGPGAERLEARVPRLGATVLDVLERQSCHVFPVFAPRIAHEIASMLYWFGEEDESLAVEEYCGDDQEAQAAMREEMITRSQITQAYPAWALSCKPQRLGQSELMRIADECKEPYVKDVASLVLELGRLRIQEAFLPEMDGQFIGFGAVLSWREDDLTVRIYDDLVNMAHEGEFCDLIGEIRFDLPDPKAMQTWQRNMRQRFKAMRLIDALIWRLTEGN